MELEEANYTIEQHSLLLAIEASGAVLETVIMTAQSDVKDIYQDSKAATLKGMEILKTRLNSSFEKDVFEPNQERYFKIEIYHDQLLTGKLVDFETFVGIGHEFDISTLELFRPRPLTKTFQSGEFGFVQALLNPPHTVSYDRGIQYWGKEYCIEEEDFYRKVVKDYFDIIFGIAAYGDERYLTIFAWSDNWSNYFDAGKEWWGTYCWTVYNERERSFIFIAASSTD